MKVFSSIACLVTILCTFTLILQGICLHDGGNRNTGIGGKMEANSHSSYNTSENKCINGIMTQGSRLVVGCCGNIVYNPLNEICCNSVLYTRSSVHTRCCKTEVYEAKTHKCCNDKILQKNYTCHVVIPSSHVPSPPAHSTSEQTSDLKCGSQPFDPNKQICCSGKAYRNSALNKCCGNKVYTPADDVVCCNEILYFTELAHESMCVGGVLYVQSNSTCLLNARPRRGEHCCGVKTYNPDEHICCNGHRYDKEKHGHFCCGSYAYDPHNTTKKCCSGHLYELQENKNAECCGNLLLKDDMKYQCCSSSTHSFIYRNTLNHHCCGHDYYNMSLWSCCAEQLKPLKPHTKTDSSQPVNRLKLLTDMIPKLCSHHNPVILGKVESMTLGPQNRLILLQVLGHIKTHSERVDYSWLSVPLDHCSAPVLEIGKTYVWMKTGENHKYEPVSQIIDFSSDMHVFFNACSHHKG